ncbi:hypothetical protein CBER1_10142 [Cercospora berteroae]|uniref:Uncharacterized protein n=1 Tax=Cercospora berteroae TaxID=357750 RepID=A0A2S6CJT6_9PEZI|nr:hypothetical protein CBER1_10142 [Cercospora berteroae]
MGFFQSTQITFDLANSKANVLGERRGFSQAVSNFDIEFGTFDITSNKDRSTLQSRGISKLSRSPRYNAPCEARRVKTSTPMRKCQGRPRSLRHGVHIRYKSNAVDIDKYFDAKFRCSHVDKLDVDKIHHLNFVSSYHDLDFVFAQASKLNHIRWDDNFGGHDIINLNDSERIDAYLHEHHNNQEHDGFNLKHTFHQYQYSHPRGFRIVASVCGQVYQGTSIDTSTPPGAKRDLLDTFLKCLALCDSKGCVALNYIGNQCGILSSVTGSSAIANAVSATFAPGARDTTTTTSHSLVSSTSTMTSDVTSGSLTTTTTSLALMTTTTATLPTDCRSNVLRDPGFESPPQRFETVVANPNIPIRPGSRPPRVYEFTDVPAMWEIAHSPKARHKNGDIVKANVPNVVDAAHYKSHSGDYYVFMSLNQNSPDQNGLPEGDPMPLTIKTSLRLTVQREYRLAFYYALGDNQGVGEQCTLAVALNGRIQDEMIGITPVPRGHICERRGLFDAPTQLPHPRIS